MIEYATNENGVVELKPIPTQAGFYPQPVQYLDSRWLRFDFQASDHRTIKVMPQTVIHYPNGIFYSKQGYSKSFSGLVGGKDYYVYLVPAENAYGGDIVASLQRDVPSDIDPSYTKGNTLRIGMFSTLCANVGSIPGDASTTNTLKNAWMAVAPGSVAVGADICRKNYSSVRYPDFYGFYKKPVVKVVANTYYDVVYNAHPLSGFVAGDILPESVWCLSWHIRGDRHRPGLVYEHNTGIGVGIYLQSGTGKSTASVYNELNIRSRQQVNHSQDMASVGMRLLGDQEFSNVAQGSNEKTAVQGASEANSTKSGGSVDTQGRRMISDIGCEDCAGKLNQWLSDVSGTGSIGWSNADGNGSFGQYYGSVRGLLAGGDWSSGSGCGSRERNGNDSVDRVYAHLGGRECQVLSTELWNEFWI